MGMNSATTVLSNVLQSTAAVWAQQMSSIGERENLAGFEPLSMKITRVQVKEQPTKNSQQRIGEQTNTVLFA